MNVKKAVVVYSDSKSAEHLRTMATVKSVLKESGVRAEFIRKEAERKRPVKGTDLVISVGGDGTFIDASHLIENGTPILGVNSDPSTSEGAHTMATRKDFRKKLRLILDGDFSIEKWTRLQPFLGKKRLPLSLNEIFIGGLYLYSTSHYSLIIDNRKEEQKSSGVLIATGCGSTAWYQSAGGRPFSKTAHEGRFIVREPYCGKLVCGRTVQGIFKDEESVTVESGMRDGIVVVDSAKSFHFQTGKRITVNISDRPLHVIVF